MSNRTSPGGIGKADLIGNAVRAMSAFGAKRTFMWVFSLYVSTGREGGLIMAQIGKIALSIGVALVVGIAPLSANSLPSLGEFVYSDLCWDKESGDASGHRVRLVRTPKGDELFLEWSDGPLIGPARAENLKIDAKHSRFSFSIPLNWPPPDNSDHYNGSISDRAIVLNGHRIPRVNTAPAELKTCGY